MESGIRIVWRLEGVGSSLRPHVEDSRLFVDFAAEGSGLMGPSRTVTETDSIPVPEHRVGSTYALELLGCFPSLHAMLCLRGLLQTAIKGTGEGFVLA